MKGLVCGLLMMGAAWAGQPAKSNSLVDRLESTLLALRHADSSGSALLGRQLSEEILSLAEKDCQPSHASAAAFAGEFVRALMGRNMTRTQVITLRQSIVEVTHSSGTTVLPASSLREALTAIGVGDSQVQSITRRFIAIGEEIRGPDDQEL